METHFPHSAAAQSQLAREQMGADLRALAGDAEILLRATAADVGDKARAARARLAAGVEKLRANCQEWPARGLEAAGAAARNVDQTVRAHPYESVGLAFCAGLLLGVLWQRR